MIKDIVLIGAGLVIGATLHGGRIVSERVSRAEDYRRYILNTQSSSGHRLKRVRFLERIRSR